MSNKKLKLLSTLCYDGKNLNEKKVFNVASQLKRADLKKFIKELKRLEAKKNVVVIMPFRSRNNDLLKMRFQNKNVIFKYDPSLIVGIRIEDDDNIYDFNLKNFLDKELSYIKNIYE